MMTPSKWVGDIEVSARPLYSPWNTTFHRLFGSASPLKGTAPLTRQTIKSAFEPASGATFPVGAFNAPGNHGDWPLVLDFDGGRAVAHSTSGGKPVHPFQDRAARHGSTPDEWSLCCEKSASPCPFEGERDDSASEVDVAAAVLALAKRLTGIHLVDTLLQDVDYGL